MAYLGRGLDKISNIEVLDNITFDGSSSYSITKGSVAFTPNSAQSCLISIDGVVQATNFSVNSSTIDFGVAIPSTSVCNFFLHYGTGVMTVPSDGSVTTAKLGDDAVTTAKINDGAITSAKLGTNVGGKVLQAQTFSVGGNNTHTTSTTYTDTVTSINITPLSSNSKILVFADHAISIVSSSSNQRCDARIFETTTSTSVTDKKYIGQDGGSHTQFNFPISLSGGFTNSSTAQKTFKVQVRKANADANECSKINLNWYTNALHTMMAIDVQA